MENGRMSEYAQKVVQDDEWKFVTPKKIYSVVRFMIVGSLRWSVCPLMKFDRRRIGSGVETAAALALVDFQWEQVRWCC